MECIWLDAKSIGHFFLFFEWKFEEGFYDGINDLVLLRLGILCCFLRRRLKFHRLRKRTLVSLVLWCFFCDYRAQRLNVLRGFETIIWLPFLIFKFCVNVETLKNFPGFNKYIVITVSQTHQFLQISWNIDKFTTEPLQFFSTITVLKK